MQLRDSIGLLAADMWAGTKPGIEAQRAATTRSERTRFRVRGLPFCQIFTARDCRNSNSSNVGSTMYLSGLLKIFSDLLAVEVSYMTQLRPSKDTSPLCEIHDCSVQLRGAAPAYRGRRRCSENVACEHLVWRLLHGGW